MTQHDNIHAVDSSGRGSTVILLSKDMRVYNLQNYRPTKARIKLGQQVSPHVLVKISKLN